MKTFFLETPRKYSIKKEITIKDMGKIELEPYEQITFIKDQNKEFDFTSFEWGFYIAPSVNKRAKDFGYKIALVLNEQDRLYINAVLEDKKDIFLDNIKRKKAKLICWLDEWFKDHL